MNNRLQVGDVVMYVKNNDNEDRGFLDGKVKLKTKLVVESIHGECVSCDGYVFYLDEIKLVRKA